jgi:hypothetical protein
VYLKGRVIRDLVLVVGECVGNINEKMTFHRDDDSMSQGKVYVSFQQEKACHCSGILQTTCWDRGATVSNI